MATGCHIGQHRFTEKTTRADLFILARRMKSCSFWGYALASFERDLTKPDVPRDVTGDLAPHYCLTSSPVEFLLELPLRNWHSFFSLVMALSKTAMFPFSHWLQGSSQEIINQWEQACSISWETKMIFHGFLNENSLSSHFLRLQYFISYFYFVILFYEFL